MVVPAAILELFGVMAIDTKVALVTVKTVEPETLSSVAVIVLLPAATEVARPLKFAALLIVAMPVLEEPQVTDVVRFCVVLLE